MSWQFSSKCHVIRSPCRQCTYRRCRCFCFRALQRSLVFCHPRTSICLPCFTTHVILKCFHFGFGAFFSIVHSKSYKKHDEWAKSLYWKLGIITHFQGFLSYFLVAAPSILPIFFVTHIRLTISTWWDFLLLKRRILEALCGNQFYFYHKHTHIHTVSVCVRWREMCFGPWKININKKKCSKNIFTVHTTLNTLFSRWHRIQIPI